MTAIPIRRSDLATLVEALEHPIGADTRRQLVASAALERVKRAIAEPPPLAELLRPRPGYEMPLSAISDLGRIATELEAARRTAAWFGIPGGLDSATNATFTALSEMICERLAEMIAVTSRLEDALRDGLWPKAGVDPTLLFRAASRRDDDNFTPSIAAE